MILEKKNGQSEKVFSFKSHRALFFIGNFLKCHKNGNFKHENWEKSFGVWDWRTGSVGSSDQIYPTELQLNKANSSDTEAPFLDLNLSITNGIVSSKIYDKRDDFNFEIVNFPFLDGDVPRSPSYGVYISQLIRFAWVCSDVDDFQWFIYNFGLMGPGTRCFQYQWVPTANLWVQNTIFNDKSAILLHPGTRWNKNLCAKDAGCAGNKITGLQQQKLIFNC